MLRFADVAKGKYKRKRLLALQRSEPASLARSREDEQKQADLKQTLMTTRNQGTNSPKVNPIKSKGIWNSARSGVQGVIIFALGVILGPVIQQVFFTWLPGSRVQSTLRVEKMADAGQPDCHFYRVTFTNFSSIDYLHAKIQFPDPITSFKVGIPPETVLSDAHREGNLMWGKGRNAEHSCIVETDGLSANTNVQSSINGHGIEIQTSKLSDPTHVIGLIATTKSDMDSRTKLWTEGDYEYSKFGLNIRKKLSITPRYMDGAD